MRKMNMEKKISMKLFNIKTIAYKFVLIIMSLEEKH